MSKIKLFPALAIACAVVLAPTTALAQGRGHGKPAKVQKAEKGHKADTADGGHSTVVREVVVDRDGHVRAIHDYAHAGSLPPGLAKREALPPGLRAQLHERGSLPPGLQKRLVPVPRPLLVRLPPVPTYYHRYFAGDDLLVIDTRTNRVAAIIADVWR
jgi:hypothetical protein